MTVKRTLTVDEACEVYNISRSTMARLRKHRDFPAVLVGRHVVIPIKAADKWFADRVGERVVVDSDPTPPHGMERSDLSVAS